jgi:Protein of unknown function (DUF3240)
MDQPACKLTLVYPPQAEDCVTELLLNSEPPLTGFTTWTAEGHGHDFGTASVRERVRGRVRRGVLTVVLPRSRLAGLLEDIRTRTPIANLAYWVEPVESFGRLARLDAPADDDLAA